MVGMIAVMAGVLIVPAMADEEGSSTGSFVLSNAAPEVTAVRITDGTDEVTSLTPQIEYTAEIDVSDVNTLNDLRYIVLTIDTDTTEITGIAEYTWTSGTLGGAGSWAMTKSELSTWGFGDLSEPEFTGTSGTFTVKFTPGKVAAEDVSGGWAASATATDAASSTSGSTAYANPIDMEWYGEITTVDSSFGFGDVDLGENDQVITVSSSGDTDVDITTLANGHYDVSSKTAATWNSDTDSAVVDPTGDLGPGEIYLKNGDGLVTDGTAVTIDPTTTIDGFESLSASTTETPTDRAFNVWLSVADSGLAPETYSGIYTVQISNGA